MFKPKPLVALISLLDLLFVLIFASLLLVEPGQLNLKNALDLIKTNFQQQANQISELNEILEKEKAEKLKLQDQLSFTTNNLQQQANQISKLNKVLEKEKTEKFKLQDQLNFTTNNLQEQKKKISILSDKPKQSLDQKSNKKYLGTWVQYVKQNGIWVEIGKYTLQRNTFGSLEMLMNSAVLNSIKTNGITNIKIINSRWSFNSDWGNNGIAYFELLKISDKSFQGWAYLSGKKVSQNLWKKIK